MRPSAEVFFWVLRAVEYVFEDAINDIKTLRALREAERWEKVRVTPPKGKPRRGTKSKGTQPKPKR